MIAPSMAIGKESSTNENDITDNNNEEISNINNENLRNEEN